MPVGEMIMGIAEATELKEKDLQALLSEFQATSLCLRDNTRELEDRLNWVLSIPSEKTKDVDDSPTPNSFLHQMRVCLEDIRGCTEQLEKMVERL